ncbi:uncharacterized protein rassf5 isoform 1-T1 [Synchiropus picturatus]
MSFHLVLRSRIYLVMSARAVLALVNISSGWCWLLSSASERGSVCSLQLLAGRESEAEGGGSLPADNTLTTDGRASEGGRERLRARHLSLWRCHPSRAEELSSRLKVLRLAQPPDPRDARTWTRIVKLLLTCSESFCSIAVLCLHGSCYRRREAGCGFAAVPLRASSCCCSCFSQDFAKSPGPALRHHRHLSMTVSTVPSPSMTSSNSMSSGYCSLDDESEDFTFFTAKTSFFRKPKHAVKRNESKEEEEGGASDLSEEEVRCRIEQYNSQVSENGMNLASDGSYTGFIKVHLRLSRPVTVPAVDSGDTEGVAKQNQAPPDAAGEAEGDRRTSFYLPCDCVKQLHISSLTTTREVIQGLLKKFMVLDNPRKFALYRQTHRDGQDLFQKLPLCERPLLLRLIAGPDSELLSFVLKENETGEVEWHAFSVPELQNFLVILEKEEAERVRAVEQKYSAYRRKLQQALQQLDP